MKVVNEIRNNKVMPTSGCVCSSGWKSTRGPWQPIWNCNCNCQSGNTDNHNANFQKAKEA